jgi:hypothetical protein
MPDDNVSTPGERRVSGAGDEAPPIEAVALGHVAELRDRVDHLATVVALLPHSERRDAARVAVTDLAVAVAAAMRALGLDDDQTG